MSGTHHVTKIALPITLVLGTIFSIICIGIFPGRCSCQVGESVYDSNCYFPSLVYPSEIDSVCGDVQNQLLGENLHIVNLNLGMTSNFPYLFTTGMLPLNSNYSAIKNTSPLNIHSLVPTVQYEHLPKETYLKPPYYDRLIPCHFHSTTVVDFFRNDTKQVYLSDEFGNVDTARYCTLSFHTSGVSYDLTALQNPIICDLDGDGLDDIVLGADIGPYPGNKPDSVFLMFYRGGQTTIIDRAILFPDSVYFLAEKPSESYLSWTTAVGDWRGSGMKDIIIADKPANLFFFRNTYKFSLSNLAESIIHDTLLAGWENPELGTYSSQNLSRIRLDGALAVTCLPKLSKDISQDLVFQYKSNTGYYRIAIKQGGADFGDQRLKLEHMDLVLESADELANGDGSPSFNGHDLYAGGDVNGSDNPTLLVHAMKTSSEHYYYLYVLGSSSDSKADLFYDPNFINDEASPVFVRANDDTLDDVLLGFPSYSDMSSLREQIGSIRVIFGSHLIPSRPNPKYGVPLNTTILDDNFNVVPLRSRSALLIEVDKPILSSSVVRVFDLLGRCIYSQSINSQESNMSSIEIPFLNLPKGTYVCVLTRNNIPQSRIFNW
ncbi:MAG: hypothetical protein JSS75_14350 [Bacteroidetes bacterium]|nr:hypothetical protein [Bacteroidota bacterium]